MLAMLEKMERSGVISPRNLWKECIVCPSQPQIHKVVVPLNLSRCVVYFRYLRQKLLEIIRDVSRVQPILIEDCKMVDLLWACVFLAKSHIIDAIWPAPFRTSDFLWRSFHHSSHHNTMPPSKKNKKWGLQKASSRNKGEFISPSWNDHIFLVWGGLALGKAAYLPMVSTKKHMAHEDVGKFRPFRTCIEIFRFDPIKGAQCVVASIIC